MDIQFEYGFSLAEALDMVCNDDLDGDIYIEPPEPNVDTDEDSADEDDGGLVDNLTARQLRAPAEIRLYNTQYEVECDANIADQETNTVPTPVLVQEYITWLKDRRNQSKSFIAQWEKGADYAVVSPKCFPPPDYSRFEMSVIQIFEEFIDDEFIKHLVAETRSMHYF
ncbi:piggyBac transposable element-derived protein 3-like [Anthonomus grandis grandis]|uniref:piggyBac transposable element-derived protein 3-like n=1 Tax=Anthonomus grandis grandis TaxID=2921223 RepID=UPI00216524DC|nr:piggyBac transposable element-derived protein 3-like [Anthonomus grandis grandis]